MTKQTLAEALRERQIELGVHPESLIRSLDDDTIIDSYVRCSHCGHCPVEGAALNSIIDKCASADEFIRAIDAADKHSHNTPPRKRKQRDVWEDRLRDGKDRL